MCSTNADYGGGGCGGEIFDYVVVERSARDVEIV